MAKVLRIAAIVVSIAAAIPTGGTSLLALGLGVSATAASAIAIGLSFASSVLAKKPAGGGGSQTSFRADPNAPIPIVFGRTLVGGDIRYRKQHGSDNKYDSMVTVLSGCGPIQSIDQTYMDKNPISFSGGLTGVYQINGNDRIWQDVQLGACPEANALSGGIGTPPGWGVDALLSGYAATMLTLKYDGKGDKTLTQTPKMNWLAHGVKGYDPRLDTTYPGGAGAQRWNDETTWGWTENPFIVAISYAIGWHQGPNQIRVGGVGMGIESIDLAAFVEAANVADANGWKIGGQITTADNKWEALKAICQAGGGEPIRNAAVLSCFVNAPRISIATITADDLIGEASITTAQTMRDRINGIIPNYRSEDHFWEVVPAACVRNATYLAEDGAERTKEVTYSLVQCAAGDDPVQASQLAAYDIANAREAGPIVLPLKLRWLGYKAGDCLTVVPTELGYIAGKDIVVLRRSLDASTASVTLTARTETPTKHAEALGATGTGTPITSTPAAPTVGAPGVGSWSIAATSITSGGVTQPALVITGATDNDAATEVIFEYRINGATTWNPAGTEPAAITRKEILGVNPSTNYDVAISYKAYGIIGAQRILTTGATVTSPYVPTGGLSGYGVLVGNNNWTGINIFNVANGGVRISTNTNTTLLGIDGATGKYAELCFSESGVSNRWTIGTKPGDPALYWCDTNTIVGTTVKFKMSGGDLYLPGHATTASAANAYIDSGTGLLARSTSSKRYKCDIEDVDPIYAERILSLTPAWYRSKCSNDNPDWGWWGFIAEDAAKIDPRLVHWGYLPDDYTKAGKLKARRKMKAVGFQYDRLGVLHHVLVAGHHAKLDDHERRLTAIEAALSLANFTPTGIPEERVRELVAEIFETKTKG